MKKSKNKSLSTLNETVVIRLTPKIAGLLKAESIETNTSVSEVARQSIMEHFNRRMSDAEIMHFSLAENSRKLRYVEKKIDLAALIILELAKNQIRAFPDVDASSDSIADKKYEKFVAGCASSLKSNHHGVLESMILDLYEQEGENGNS